MGILQSLQSKRIVGCSRLRLGSGLETRLTRLGTETRRSRLGLGSGLRIGWALTKKRSVVVNIAGQKLTVKSDADETYIRTLAGYLDRRIEEVRSSSRPASSQKLAILVALNLADECFQERRKRGELKQRVRDKASDILTYITKEQRKHASTKN
ncbi:MAG: hypothetical protein CSA65_03490 [Proteobacteria bacterium]|nr:MAG: hypothetical protein CSA65_03490 [Pseudomonadota bacterium]